MGNDSNEGAMLTRFRFSEAENLKNVWIDLVNLFHLFERPNQSETDLLCN